MAMKNRIDTLIWWLSPLGIFAVYLAAYLASTEVFPGRLGDTRYRIRLFRSVWHYRVFQPLLAVEGRLRPANPQFSGQVHSGASLPPPDEPSEEGEMSSAHRKPSSRRLNPAAAGNGAITISFHAGRLRRAVPEPRC